MTDEGKWYKKVGERFARHETVVPHLIGQVASDKKSMSQQGGRHCSRWKIKSYRNNQ
jgi:hypothetical protein